MSTSRAGRTGGSWYGSYKVHTIGIDGRQTRFDVTNKRRAITHALRALKAEEIRSASIVDASGDVVWERSL